MNNFQLNEVVQGLVDTHSPYQLAKMLVEITENNNCDTLEYQPGDRSLFNGKELFTTGTNNA